MMRDEAVSNQHALSCHTLGDERGAHPSSDRRDVECNRHVRVAMSETKILRLRHVQRARQSCPFTLRSRNRGMRAGCRDSLLRPGPAVPALVAFPRKRTQRFRWFADCLRRLAVSVLLVQHEDVDASFLTRALEPAGFRVTIQNERDLPRLDAAAFEVVVIGVAGELGSRVALCQRLRLEGYRGAIVALSTDSEEPDRLVDAGADDFAASPIQASELVVRVRAALRRVAMRAVRWGPLEIDRVQRS